MIEIYRGPRDLALYRAWMFAHASDGFVLNRHWNTTLLAFRGVIHRTNCTRIQDYLGPPANPLANGRYKACSIDLAALQDWGTYTHRAAPHTPPSRCARCP
jgi:hypothetical protein